MRSSTVTRAPRSIRIGITVRSSGNVNPTEDQLWTITQTVPRRDGGQSEIGEKDDVKYEPDESLKFDGPDAKEGLGGLAILPEGDHNLEGKIPWVEAGGPSINFDTLV